MIIEELSKHPPAFSTNKSTRKMMYTTPSLYQAFEPSYILVISDNGNISREKLTYPHLTISQSVIG
jgi:hypothetical protein